MRYAANIHWMLSVSLFFFHVQNNFRITLWLSSCWQSIILFLTKWPQILRTIKTSQNKNLIKNIIIGNWNTNCFYPINLMVWSCKEPTFSCLAIIVSTYLIEQQNRKEYVSISIILGHHLSYFLNSSHKKIIWIWKYNATHSLQIKEVWPCWM